MSFSDIFNRLKQAERPRDPLEERVLGYAKEHGGKVTVPDLQQALGVGFYAVQRTVASLVKKEELVFEGGLVYGLPKKEEEQAEGEREEEPQNGLRNYLERRRQELMSSFEDEDEDDDDDNEDGDFDLDFVEDDKKKSGAEDADDEDLSFDEFVEKLTREPDRLKSAALALDRGIDTVCADGGVRLIPFGGFKVGGQDLVFKLYDEDGSIYLSDDGAAMRGFRASAPFVPEDIDSRIRDIIGRYHVRRKGDEMCIEVPKESLIVHDLLRLFATVDRIAAIDVGEHCTLAIDRRRRTAARKLAGELLNGEEHPSRETVIGRLQSHLAELGKAPQRDVDASIVALTAIEIFSEMTDETFSARTAYWLGGEERKQGSVPEDERPSDPICLEALALVVREQRASMSLIQRKCGIGYARAGRIIEWMEAMGYISPFDGKAGRKINLTPAQYVSLYGPLD